LVYIHRAKSCKGWCHEPYALCSLELVKNNQLNSRGKWW
jgi:hypothetical protein